MNYEQLIAAAGDAIALCLERRVGTFKLLVRKEKLLCVPRTSSKPEDILITSITRWQMDNGLTNEQWDFVGKKLIKVMGDKKS